MLGACVSVFLYGANLISSRTPPASAPRKAIKAKKPAGKVKPPVDEAGPAPSERSRRNTRSEETIAKILAATGKVLLDSGTEKLSILDVCREAQISRGTFYRYFSSQEDLLEAYSKDNREQRYRGLVQATQPHQDPNKRFQAFVDYFSNSIQAGQLQRLLLVAPEYALAYITRIFHDSIIRFQDVLEPTFDDWDQRMGGTLDRELICEVFIRVAISEHLVPAGKDQQPLARRIERMLTNLAGSSSARARR